MKITISPKWLNATGKQHLNNVQLEVLHVQDFGFRGKFYEVALPNSKHTWVVWDERGITVHP